MIIHRAIYRWLRMLAAVCLLACTGPVLAQTAAEPAPRSPDDEQTAERESQTTPDNGQAAAGQAEPGQNNAAGTPAKQRRTDDIFRPSEEISEDFAVSFPVDI